MPRIAALAAALGCLAGTAMTAAPALAVDICTCRAPGGKRVELGGTACLPTPAGPRLARCTVDVNIMSWKFLDTPCTVSQTPLPPGGHRLAAAVATTPTPP